MDMQRLVGWITGMSKTMAQLDSHMVNFLCLAPKIRTWHPCRASKSQGSNQTRSTQPKGNTTTVNICMGGWRWFVEAVLPATPITPSLQIKGLQGRFPSRPYKCICRGSLYHQPPPQLYLQGRLVTPAASTKIICRDGCNTSRPYNSYLQGRFTLEPPLQYIFVPKN